jgi:hypothetical protein
LKPSKIGDPDFSAAIAQSKIAQAPDEDLKQSLRYAMLLVGIRAQNMPQEEERAVLLSFVRRTYPGHTAAEIRLAFEKAVSGELNLSPDEVKPYENFSCEYIGRIMRAYRAWAASQYKEHEKVAQDEPERLESPKLSAAEFVDFFYQSYLAKTIDMDLLPEMAYDRAKTCFGMDFPEEKLKAIVLRAREAVLSHLTEEAKVTDAERHYGQYLALKREIDAIREIDPLDSCEIATINRKAKIYALAEFFAEQRAKGIKSLITL